MSLLAQRIAQRRRQRDLSQDDLATLVDTTQKQISKYENGINNPTADVLAKIAIALDTTTDWLLGLTDYPSRPLRNMGDLNDLERKAVELLRSQNVETQEKMVNVLEALV